jgi:hypothetical protein
MLYRSRLALVLLPTLMALVGCGGGKALIVHHPNWNYEAYERIAVLPGSTLEPQAMTDAARLADQLETYLAGNGAFEVVSRANLRDVMQEQDLAKIPDMVDQGTAMPTGMIRIAQAIVDTRITEYRLTRTRQIEQVPVYARDRKGRVIRRNGQPIVTGHQNVPVFTHAAEVGGSVRVIDTATSQILMSRATRVAPRPLTSRGEPPRATPEQIAAQAVQAMAVEFYQTIAPTRMEVRLKGDMLIVATGYFDGEYDETDKLSPALDSFLLVVRNLPEECIRNQFRVAISPKDGRMNLVDETFEWDGANGRRGLSFEVPMALLQGGGADEFEAKLYSGRDEKPVLERGFRIESDE